ncbi:putative Pts system mannose-specific eiiab component (Eiiab-man) [uncultured Eubacteriales bacterium]|uniref:Putative Pts system mannose-specific eiiab component (Eiiab-man) n=1 Tax=uncultured Eubacteriales bacterium TaxID=172733 RepID=A0A212K0Z3_9FIRM|nr:putative Pts system mannose-specific eiiab component (Eiiab-man) [uncultured Eubacteriales bacterium]
MISIILTGHGSFAEGLYSAAKLITGQTDALLCVTFPESDSTEDLREKLKAAIDAAEGEVLVLADMMGGSPFKESVLLRAALPERKIEVVAGASVPMVISALLGRDGESLNSLIPHLLEGAKFAIRQYVPAAAVTAPDDGDEGI